MAFSCREKWKLFEGAGTIKTSIKKLLFEKMLKKTHRKSGHQFPVEPVVLLFSLVDFFFAAICDALNGAHRLIDSTFYLDSQLEQYHAVKRAL